MLKNNYKIFSKWFGSKSEGELIMMIRSSPEENKEIVQNNDIVFVKEEDCNFLGGSFILVIWGMFWIFFFFFFFFFTLSLLLKRLRSYHLYHELYTIMFHRYATRKWMRERKKDESRSKRKGMCNNNKEQRLTSRLSSFKIIEFQLFCSFFFIFALKSILNISEINCHDFLRLNSCYIFFLNWEKKKVKK